MSSVVRVNKGSTSRWRRCQTCSCGGSSRNSRWPRRAGRRCRAAA